MNFIKGDLLGTWIIEPRRFGDERGYFCETFRQDEFDRAVGHVTFIQDNESLSSHGVLRGLHYQRGDASQAKLVRVSQGAVVDVVVDLRRESPTYGRYMAVELSAANGRQLYMPHGMAHGFVVTSETAQFQYKVDRPYVPEAEMCLRYDDPTVGVKWPEIDGGMILSPKDLKGLSWDEIEKF